MYIYIYIYKPYHYFIHCPRTAISMSRRQRGEDIWLHIIGITLMHHILLCYNLKNRKDKLSVDWWFIFFCLLSVCYLTMRNSSVVNLVSSFCVMIEFSSGRWLSFAIFITPFMNLYVLRFICWTFYGKEHSRTMIYKWHYQTVKRLTSRFTSVRVLWSHV